MTVVTHSESETGELGARLASCCTAGTVVAFFGGLGMGKTAFVRGMASVLSPDAHVSSPTFALVNNYGGTPPLVHFDMYRVTGWEDLDTTGYYDYQDQGAILAVEWSENIEMALPSHAVRVTFRRLSETEREITIEGVTLS
ncbi:MAG: tRNA (adenosine(37)-N6)-threonylcarbamoyltransferase complex ATPase subunit type 1 TsaE [Clostridia bacterium]|nr:tRNA (adenosine(37)-N6)-threonylcarbamoyltransferase complex ATPase subunit type 1 TsaE [Clostridia bacterium]